MLQKLSAFLQVVDVPNCLCAAPGFLPDERPQFAKRTLAMTAALRATKWRGQVKKEACVCSLVTESKSRQSGEKQAKNMNCHNQ
jgi:hypothetical protein